MGENDWIIGQRFSLDKKKQNEPLALNMVEGTNGVDKTITFTVNENENIIEVKESEERSDGEFVDATQMDERVQNSQAIMEHDKEKR